MKEIKGENEILKMKNEKVGDYWLGQGRGEKRESRLCVVWETFCVLKWKLAILILLREKGGSLLDVSTLWLDKRWAPSRK